MKVKTNLSELKEQNEGALICGAGELKSSPKCPGLVVKEEDIFYGFIKINPNHLRVKGSFKLHFDMCSPGVSNSLYKRNGLTLSFLPKTILYQI